MANKRQLRIDKGTPQADKDMEMIKAHFAENDELLHLMRRLFFGDELSKEEKDAIKSTFKNKELIETVRRKVYGLKNFAIPIGHFTDFWLGTEKQVFGAHRDTIEQVMKSKEIVFQMFDKAFRLLENPDGEKVSVDILMDTAIDPLQINLLARNSYMEAIETSLIMIKTIAGKKDETVEETVKRLQKDSAK